MSADWTEFQERVTRRLAVGGFLAVGTLGEVQIGVNEQPVKRGVCKRHRYREGKWFLRCEICGHIEDYEESQPGVAA